MKSPYKRININKKTVSIHNLLMEKKIGRKLLPGECVHHKDFNSRNNNIKNLQLMTISEHSKLHGKRRRVRKVVVCDRCKKEFEMKMNIWRWKKAHGQKKFWCSRDCLYNSKNKNIAKLISDGLKKGLSGYRIAKNNNLNNSTVYSRISYNKAKSS